MRVTSGDVRRSTYRVLFHIFRHINANNFLLRSKVRFGQSLAPVSAKMGEVSAIEKREGAPSSRLVPFEYIQFSFPWDRERHKVCEYRNENFLSFLYPNAQHSPVPVGPQNKKEAMGRLGSRKPDLARRTARATPRTARP